MGKDDFEIVLHKKSAVTNVHRKVKDILLKNKILFILNSTTKRIIDISSGIIGTMMLIPVTLLVIVINAIYREKGPIFYKQDRIRKKWKII